MEVSSSWRNIGFWLKLIQYTYSSVSWKMTYSVWCAGGKNEPLSWDLRVRVALDVARGLEYLHDGVCFNITLINTELCNRMIHSCGVFMILLQAVPPVIHRDIKSSNILLDDSMRARVYFFFNF